jgi:dGTPase
MKDLKERILAANIQLAPYAVPYDGGLGRPIKESEDETRFPFQRDRGRIIHSQAFRRLQGKTQVFVAGEGDHFRTRLTHTMEVAQISRDIARTLQLNEDVAECIALAHDVGHPPFGHMGEQAIDTWMREHGSSFEHNEQSLRIVTLLEDHSPFAPGLNLNREILEGLQKHTDVSLRERSLSLEAQLVNIADEIAYISHDCEDGIRAELFMVDDLKTMSLVSEALEHSRARSTELRGAIIHLLVTDLYKEIGKTLQEKSIHTLDDVYHASSPLIKFCTQKRNDINQLRQFLAERMYAHPRVLERGQEGQRIVHLLCEAFFKNPPDKVLALQKKTESTLVEAVKDYVAGMTDMFARNSVES